MHADRLDEDVLESRGFAQQDRFARRGGDASRRSAGWRGADEGAVVRAELRHTGFVAEDAAAGERARGIDRQDRDSLVTLADDVHPEGFNESALADAGDAGDAVTDRIAGVRQARLDQLSGAFTVVRARAFDQGDGLGERGAIAGKNAVEHVGERSHEWGAAPLRSRFRFAVRVVVGGWAVGGVERAWRISRAAAGMRVPGPDMTATPR